jgi:hypothetical protein
MESPSTANTSAWEKTSNFWEPQLWSAMECWASLTLHTVSNHLHQFQGSFQLISFAAKANAYYNILDTDYDNYAIIFSCNNYYGFERF